MHKFSVSLIKFCKKVEVQDSLIFFLEQANQMKIEQYLQQSENISQTESECGKNQIKIPINFLSKLKDHEFNKVNYSRKDYKQINEDLITKIPQNNKIIELLKFLVRLTALDEGQIQCGSNSLHLLVQMKVDLKEQSFENIRIIDTSLLGANEVRCDLSGSEFENVNISGNEFKLNQIIQLINEVINQKVILVMSIQFFFLHLGNHQPLAVMIIPFVCGMLKQDKIKTVLTVGKQVKSARLSPKQTILASCSGKVVYLCNLQIGKQISKLISHKKKANSICFSPDGTTLASSSQDKSISLWDVKTGQKKPNQVVIQTQFIQSVTLLISIWQQTLVYPFMEFNIWISNLIF
ncbi:unnamed protein product (macronuclear) [Paramecium tetraurelia]|uniref:Anaphase-promoting complex subunit 4 WD40 domain-containing protein n=1 Tax=Paramecium tetraurelia TaxID=5888 RepID=A0CPY5_PARTE|nr:uncharacterized protein GSPATT00038809001 [Paramecium tetraurelia]CAK72852.1 unnamed protein product [Paramecium tetraurelia]|eukprot:XP_001440249.1 hypothetical protein (macronuclear) [Paramecium tetraurelia strain d4-2]